MKEPLGALVADVVKGSPANDAGIQPGDVIREVNKKAVKDLNAYRKAMGGLSEDMAVIFLINRGNQTFSVSLKVP